MSSSLCGCVCVGLLAGRLQGFGWTSPIVGRPVLSHNEVPELLDFLPFQLLFTGHGGQGKQE